jgi:hypothetical protein
MPVTGIWDGSQWLPIQGLQGPTGAAGSDGADGATGPQGDQGPPGPSSVSTDAGNEATLGSDQLIYVPNFALDGTELGAGVQNEASAQPLPLGVWTSIVSVNFVKPAEWVTYDVVVQGEALIIEASGGVGQVRTNLGSSGGAGIRNIPPTAATYTLGTAGKATGRTGDETFSIQALEQQPGLSHFGASISFVAVRTS